MNGKQRVALTLAAVAGCSVCWLALAQKPRPAEPPPLAKIDFPAYSTKSLPNGLTVYVLEHHEQPVAAVRLLIRTGAQHDPPGIPGLATFTAAMLDKGTAKRSANEIANAIDGAGGSLSVTADMESTVIASAVFANKLPLALDLVSDVALNPKFDTAEIERTREQAMSSLAASLDDPAYVANAVFDRVLYGDHPYGHPADGTPQSVAAIQQSDLSAFHARNFTPAQAVLTIAGDVRSEDAFKQAEQWFAAWKPMGSRDARTAEVPKAARRIVVVDKADTVQTEIRIGQASVTRKDPAYFSILFGSQILGGGSTSRLNTKLRVERGLTYGAFAGNQPRIGVGVFSGSTQTRTEKTAEAVSLMLDLFRQFSSAPVREAELLEAKAIIIGGFPLTIETPGDLATRLSNIFLYDLGADYLKTYRDRLAAVTAADIQAAFKARFDADRMSIVLVGNASKIVPTLALLGKPEVIPIQRLDLQSPSLVR